MRMHQTTSALIPMLFLIAALESFSCSGPGAGGPAIPEDAFVDCYAHLLVTREEGVITGADSLKMKAQSDSLCGSFGLTREQIDGELRYYREEPARWKGILDKIIARLQVMEHEKRPSGAGLPTPAPSSP